MMNPQGYPAEATPMQPRYDGHPGQPGGPTVVPYTTVNISSEPPKDHIIWSLFNFVYVNPFCLGLAALIHSVKARDRKAVGDLQGARHYASKARSLNIAATVLGSIIFLICLTLTILAAIRVLIAINDSYGYRYRYEDRYRYGDSYNSNYGYRG